MAAKKFSVIGGDAAGMSAASRAKRLDPDIDVEVFEMGNWVSYAACGIPYFVEGKVDRLDQLQVVTPGEFEKKRDIKINLWHKVEGIDPKAGEIVVTDLEGGGEKKVSYDSLLIATGASAIVPPGIDVDYAGIFPVRGLDEAKSLDAYIKDGHCRRAVLIGAGYIGLEMAEALSERGLSVTVLEMADRVMPAAEEEISAIIAEKLYSRGVKVINGAAADGVERSGKKLIVSADGDSYEGDVVVVGIGVRPNSGLAEEAGLKLGVKKAIHVDRWQKTDADGIYSGGDCAEAYHLIKEQNDYIPLALTANRQGRVVGANIAGKEELFPGMLGSAVTKLFDLEIGRTGIGMKEAKDLGLDAVKVKVDSFSRAHYYPGGKKIRMALIVEKGSGRLLGAQMAGEDGVAHRINHFATALGAGLSLEQIMDLDLAYAPPFSPVWDPVLIGARVARKKV